MAQDKYISELDEKTSGDITGSYVFVIQSPGGQANSTYKITVAEVLNWIQSNTNYTEVYSLPVEEVPVVGDTKITVIENGGGSPVSRTEAIRIKALNKNVGFKTNDPQSSVEVWSSDPVNGDIMITPESGDRMGFHVMPSDPDSSPVVSAALHIGRKIYGEDSSFVPLVSIQESGDSVINGFTQLGGSSAPEIKMISISGTTGTIDSNPVVSIAHGINKDKIVSCNVLVKDSSGNWISPNDRMTPDKMFSFSIDATNLNVILEEDSPSRSSGLESSEFVSNIIFIK